ncbi:hypothetical protein POREN0001_0742 [Porphyromonas endodontalis ATCC 35406]|uniref:Uncharacterized protein n=1 Tax=Porphyromonas endodontalis (strain ATCC 35406 / DSM 24491 / JCM 8526 / CCUG 16442 / BCRC 14492 / NCTC 13058 / HG 370) TaxID=553175 RepID=C3J9J1_POREA|nr:hypothetical protein POREN0001_0742 [Porphyromonas endodontalis ATCC 35406]
MLFSPQGLVKSRGFSNPFSILGELPILGGWGGVVCPFALEKERSEGRRRSPQTFYLLSLWYYILS